MKISVAIAAFLPALTTATSYLRATALVTTSQNVSALQCWQFDTPLKQSTDAGTSGTLALDLIKDSKDIVYLVLPPRYDGGLHRAPTMQFVLFTSGLAHVSLPSSPAEAYIVGSSGAGLIVAADTTGTGHFTRYPGNEPTIAFEIPFAKDHVPKYHVLNATGPCTDQSQVVDITQ